MYNQPSFNTSVMQGRLTSLGWTYQDVVAATGLSNQSVSRIVRGLTKKRSSVKKVADALGLTMDELMLVSN